ncbi:MAG TPA: glycosyltransferase family 2 protein [Candidatus Peribacterales bacterium]|nr:glycosyltransferase family 2 protein [Candidatus Peribacterales bacterium]
MKTAAIIPAWNEARAIGPVIRSAAPHVDTVIVVDDGSTDATAEAARVAGAVVLCHPINCGPGAATMTGIYAARFMGIDAIVTLDADGQHNPEDIPRLFKPIQKGEADLVIGSRFKNRGTFMPFIRRVFNGVGNIFTFVVTGRYVSDSQSGFKAFGPDAVRSIHLHLSGFEFCSEIIREVVQHGWRVTEVPIKVVYSEYTLAKGQSFSRGVITACKMLLRSFLR